MHAWAASITDIPVLSLVISDLFSLDELLVVADDVAVVETGVIDVIDTIPQVVVGT